jgi:hypothetical protein
MKAMELLKYMDMADPKFVEEASDRSLLLYRKRRKRTRMAVAACLALTVLAGVAFAKPALYAWETRNTVTSWTNPNGFTYIGFDGEKPSAPIYVSAEMPDKKRFSAETPFTLSVGLGQVSDYEYATLSVHAQGFEITDNDGNTATHRYVRTISDFNSGEYGTVQEDRRVTACQYGEDFTFRYVGTEDGSEQGTIVIRLKSRDESGSMGDSVRLYYAVKNGVLKLTDKRPAYGGQEGEMILIPEGEEVVPTQENIAVRPDLKTHILSPGQFLDGFMEITARVQPRGTVYPTDGFTAKLVYAESLREEDFSFTVKYPAVEMDPTVSDPQYVYPICRVPDNAPIGSYDLVVTEEATGFTWTFENMALVLPAHIPAYEDFTFKAFPFPPSLLQGDYWPSGGWEPFTLTLNGEDAAYQCRAELQYRTEQDGVRYSITVRESMVSSHLPPAFIPADAPVGWYNLVVTHEMYGYTWRVENFVEILENPEAQRFGIYHDMGKKLTVSLSSGEVCTFIATLENRGEPFTVTETGGEGFYPKAILTEWKVTGGEPDTIPLLAVTGPYTPPYGHTVATGQTGSMIYELMLDPDISCGMYTLILSYGDCVRVFEDLVEVVP